MKLPTQYGTMARQFFAGHIPIKAGYRFFRQGDIRSLLYCNPCEVHHIVEHEGLLSLKKVKTGRLIVQSKAWRDQVRPIKKTIPNETVRDIWVKGISYRKTRQYETMMAAVAAHEKGSVENPANAGAYWCRSQADVEKYFQNLLRAWEAICTEGYKSQSELAGTNTPGRHSQGDELNILITSEGNPAFISSGGNHRFSICRLLGLTKVPCRLRFLDHAWLLPALSPIPQGFRIRMKRLMHVVQEQLNGSQPSD